MRYLKNFVCGPYIRLKNPSVALNATRSATRILLRGRGLEPKANIFPQKLFNLGPVLNKLMPLKRITGGRAPSPWAIFMILRKKIAILMPFQSLLHVFKATSKATINC